MKRFIEEKYAMLRPDGIVMLWLGLWWLLNLVQAGFSELAHDEAYYDMFAEHLAWGYFDHPPMTALLVWAGEHLFGGELGVRFFFTLLQPIYLWILWRLVRPDDTTRRDASLFVMISASMLMLQLYGFIAVPDGPLMFSTAVFLWAFDAFAREKRGAWLMLGVAMALLAYAKYHGVLVVLFAFIPNWRLLLRPHTYAAGAVTLLLLIPHLIWQYNHDWASFAYHLSDRNRTFEPDYLPTYLLNLWVVFNPFLAPLYIKAIAKNRPTTPLERALKWTPVAFFFFFLASLAKGDIQPQWLIVIAFGLISTLLAYARHHERTRRYIMRVGWVTLALLALVRIEMIFNPLGIRFEVFDNHATFDAIAHVADGRPVIFHGKYSTAAKYHFYTREEAFCEPDIFYRTHQWQFRDDDDRFAGREVVLESWPEPTDSASVVQSIDLANGKNFTWRVDPCFRPVRRVDVKILSPMDEAVSPGEELTLELELHNPYDYEITVGEDYRLTAIWKSGRFFVREYPLAPYLTLPPHGSARCTIHTTVYEELAGHDFKLGFTLRRPGYTHWFNGKPISVKVTEK